MNRFLKWTLIILAFIALEAAAFYIALHIGVVS